jgi:hypothetical protein
MAAQGSQFIVPDPKPNGAEWSCAPLCDFRLSSVFFQRQLIAKSANRDQRHGDRQQRPVVEHKGLFSRRSVFGTYEVASSAS